MTSRKALPVFASEAEEARWWFEHADELLEDFEQAAKDGTLGHGSVAALAGLSPVLHIDPSDARLAKELAERKGSDYETYVKTLLHEALLKEVSSEAPASSAA